MGALLKGEGVNESQTNFHIDDGSDDSGEEEAEERRRLFEQRRREHYRVGEALRSGMLRDNVMDDED